MKDYSKSVYRSGKSESVRKMIEYEVRKEMTNPTFPWPMDKPVEEILQSFEEMSDKRMFFGFDGCSFTFSRYLLHRLKLAEGERDRLHQLIVDRLAD